MTLARELKSRGLWVKTQTAVSGDGGFRHVADILLKTHKGRKIVVDVDTMPTHPKEAARQQTKNDAIDKRLKAAGLTVLRYAADDVTTRGAAVLADSIVKRFNPVTLAENNVRVRSELDKILKLFHGSDAAV
jgi:very-short-patch-repair endonuclease